MADGLGDVELLQIGVRIGAIEADANVVYCDGRSWREVLSPASRARVRDAVHRLERPPLPSRPVRASPQAAVAVPAATTEFATPDDHSRSLTSTIRAVDVHLAVLRPARILDFALRTGSAEATVVIHYLARSRPEA